MTIDEFREMWNEFTDIISYNIAILNERKETVKKKDMILTENFCDECDTELNAAFDCGDFFAYKVGRIKCPVCGHVNNPCNECDERSNCEKCPWKRAKAKVSKAMTDEEYIRYIRVYEPELYELFKSGDNGHYYDETIEKVEVEEKKRKFAKGKKHRISP